MPKDKVDAAIKRASSKEEKDYQEITYEGYAPHGVPVLVECATDNPTRTVANIRLHFSKNGGSMGNSGSVSFLFERKGVFKFDPSAINLEELELDLIDAGVIRYDAFERTPEQLLFFDGMVVVMGGEVVMPAKGAPNAGRRLERRYTNVWMQRDGGWRLVVRHANNVCRDVAGR